MLVEIDGVDITHYIAFGGLKWSRNDIDAQNAGRALDGTMIRDRVATKIRLDITCRPLKAEELSQLLNLIQEFLRHEDISVTLNTYTHLSVEGKKETALMMGSILNKV